jgi:DNA-binding transcriptional LysR family regulator
MAISRSIPELNGGSRDTETGGDQGAGRRWLGVEFRHLGALEAVAREGSFRRAAESLGYVQSAISGQIAQLERAVGTRLVERSSGSARATLTPAGRVLLSHVGEIMARFEAARVDVRSLAEGTGDVVRVAVLEGVGQHRLPRILRSFCDEFPIARVMIDENYGDEMNFNRLASGELDLLITELPLPAGPYDHTLLERDTYVLLVHASSPLASQANPPTADQLSRLPLILPAPLRQQDRVASRLRENGIDQPAWLRPRSAASVQALVAAGLGVAVVPRLVVDPEDESTVAIEAPALLLERLIVLVRHREREYSESVRRFIELVENDFDPAGASG